MHKDILYKKPFIKEVVFRIDFPSPLPELGNALPLRISKIALKNFPIAEPKKSHAQEFQFSGRDVQASNTTEVMQWVFHGKEREKTLTIAPDAIILQIKRYKTYEKLSEDILNVLNEFFKTYEGATASRIGLRYVNVIDINKGDPLSWKEYINEKMLGIIDFNEDKNFISRMFHILEYNYDGQTVKYQFGIANPDYPAPIKRKQFVLDIDSYYQGAFDYEDISKGISKSHDTIQDIFEKSITDRTRTLMKKVKVKENAR